MCATRGTGGLVQRLVRTSPRWLIDTIHLASVVVIIVAAATAIIVGGRGDDGSSAQ